MSWALDQPLSGHEKVLLIGIASHADKFGANAWPSRETLARYMGTSVRTMQRTCASLVETGWIEVEVQGGGLRGHRNDRRPNLYRLKAMIDGVTEGVLPSDQRGDKSAYSGVTTDVPRTVLIEPSTTPTPPPAPSEPSVVASEANDLAHQRALAQEVVKEWWEWATSLARGKPPVSVKFVALLGVVKPFLAAGYEPESITKALRVMWNDKRPMNSAVLEQQLDGRARRAPVQAQF